MTPGRADTLGRVDAPAPAAAVTATRPRPARREPRQARSAETRRRLLDAGFTAFAAKGHDGVNLVEDVLEPAGISIGSFYHQFADKTELLSEILSEAALRRRAFIAHLGDLDASLTLTEAVRSIIERLYESLATDTTAWQLQRSSRISGAGGVRAMGSANRENWADDVAAMLANWYDAPVARRRAAADSVMALGRGLISDYLDGSPSDRTRQRRRAPATADFAVGGIVAALGTPRSPADPLTLGPA